MSAQLSKPYLHLRRLFKQWSVERGVFVGVMHTGLIVVYLRCKSMIKTPVKSVKFYFFDRKFGESVVLESLYHRLCGTAIFPRYLVNCKWDNIESFAINEDPCAYSTICSTLTCNLSISILNCINHFFKVLRYMTNFLFFSFFFVWIH